MVLVAMTLAAVLLLVEVALPTFGVAGLSGLGLVVVALIAAGDQGEAWWPLVSVAAAVSLWAVLLTGRWDSPVGQLVAAGLFAVGSVGYGLLAEDALTVALGVAGSAALPAAFRPLLRATNRLLDLPPQLGMDSLVGRPAEVAQWSGRSGSVRLEGSLWNATSEAELTQGAEVVVVGHTGMTLRVALRAAVP